jgi:hypothetical protein
MSFPLRPLRQQQSQLQRQQRRNLCRFSARFQVLRAESGKQILSCARLDLKPAAPFAPVITGGGRFFIRVRHGLKFCPRKPLNATQLS